LGAVTTTSCVAAPAVTVAVNVTGLPVAPESAALTVAVPAVAGSVQLVRRAMPLASVVAVTLALGGAEPLAVVIVPPLTEKVTAAPDTGLLAPSRTTTAGSCAAATAEPATPVSVVPTLGEIDAVVPAPIVTAAVADVTPADEKVSVTGPVEPLTPRSVKVAVPVPAVVAPVPPTSE
jgi:hypothetical protein